MIIRNAAKNDIPGLVALLRELFSIEVDFDFDEKKQALGLALMFDDEANRKIFVAEDDGNIIGMVTVQLIISTAEGAPSGLIEDMVIAIPHRGKGVGSKLLAAIEEWAHEQGATRLQLLADADNIPAHDFYKKNCWTNTNLICMRKK